MKTQPKAAVFFIRAESLQAPYEISYMAAILPPKHLYPASHPYQLGTVFVGKGCLTHAEAENAARSYCIASGWAYCRINPDKPIYEQIKGAL